MMRVPTYINDRAAPQDGAYHLEDGENLEYGDLFALNAMAAQLGDHGDVWRFYHRWPLLQEPLTLL